MNIYTKKLSKLKHRVSKTITKLFKLELEEKVPLNVEKIVSFLSKVFAYAKVYLSMNNEEFTGEPVYFTYMPDLVLEQAREVTIKLHSRAGRFLKLQLYFAVRWIMLSEVIFESGKQIG